MFATIEERQQENNSVFKKYFGADHKPKRAPNKDASHCELDDENIIRKARTANDGEKFLRLWNGDATGYASQSEADMALCMKLAFWCNRDEETMGRLFYKSKLYRKKWDEVHNGNGETYGQITIGKAIAEQTETYFTGASPEPLKSGSILECLNANEDGDAQMYVNLHRGTFCYDRAMDDWYSWNNDYWELDKTGEALPAIQGVVQEYAAEAKRQAIARICAEKNGRTTQAESHQTQEKELLKRVRALQTVKRKRNILVLAGAGRESLGITGEEWDRKPWKLGCKNGVVDLRSGNHRRGRPGDYIKTVAPHDWQGLEVKAPIWESTLLEIFGNDKKLVSYIQRLFGYGIIGKSNEAVLPIFCGKGRNGKTTLLEAIKHTIGDLAHKAEAELLLEQKYARQAGAPNSSVLSLRGRRIVWASETGEGRKLNAAKVKELTGDDTLNARAPYGRRNVEFKPSHLLIVLTNNKPTTPAGDYAIWERIHLIPFKFSFVENPQEDFEREADPFLNDKLREEAPGILAWLVRGCMDYQMQRLNPPGAVRAATEEYRQEEDIIGKFIEECCVVKPSYQVQAGPLYKKYTEWCLENGHYALKGRSFGKEMRERFDSYQRRNYFYVGIELRTDETDK